MLNKYYMETLNVIGLALTRETLNTHKRHLNEGQFHVSTIQTPNTSLRLGKSRFSATGSL